MSIPAYHCIDCRHDLVGEFISQNPVFFSMNFSQTPSHCMCQLSYRSYFSLKLFDAHILYHYILGISHAGYRVCVLKYDDFFFI